MTATPAAAPAAPAAAAPAPAAAPAAAAPAPAPTPAAPAAATPPAAPAPAPAPDAPSLIDGAVTPEPAKPAAQMTLEEAQRVVKEAAAAADPNSGKAWLLTDGVMGTGEKPSWFKSDKYKTVTAQAEAYTALEGRFGAFVGAPKDGKYDLSKFAETINADHPIVQELTKWAGASQLSQAGFEDILGKLAEYDQAQQPDMEAAMARIGENASERIGQVAGWVKANLGPEGVATFRQATNGNNADAVFKLVEQLVKGSAQPRIPATKDVSPTNVGEGLEAIQAKFAEKLPDGRLRIDAEPGRRAALQKELEAYFGDMPAGTRYIPTGFKST